MDGAGLGWSDATHCDPAFAFGPAQHARGVSVWHAVERGGRALSGAYREPAVGLSRDLDVAFLSFGLYAAEEENSSVHAAGGLPRGDADFDRMGGGVRGH